MWVVGGRGAHRRGMPPPLPPQVKVNGAENAIEGAPPARNDRNGPLRVFPVTDRSVIESMLVEMEIRLHVHEVVRGKRQLVQIADVVSWRVRSAPVSVPLCSPGDACGAIAAGNRRGHFA